MKQEELKNLLDKYLSGEALTEEETTRLRNWDRHFESNDDWFSKLTEQEQSILKRQMWERIQDEVKPDKRVFRIDHSFRRRIAVAASIVALIGLALLWKLNGAGDGTREQRIEAMAEVPDILPGGNKALLILADGEAIVLDTLGNGLISSQINVDIFKKNDGEISYNDKDAETAEIQYNIIKTPSGGQFRIELADGTIAWLNSSSSLRFPTRFVGDKRVVELTGEGYFDVARDEKKPFFVQVGNSTVQALGTEFNINGHDEVIKTTLIEGSVEVVANQNRRILKPGEQAVYNPEKETLEKSRGVILEEVVAWKNGYFYFHDKPLKEILKNLKYWYNADVIYQDEINDLYSIKVSRNVPISTLLSYIELSGGVRFTIVGQSVIVKK